MVVVATILAATAAKLVKENSHIVKEFHKEFCINHGFLPASHCEENVYMAPEFGAVSD